MSDLITLALELGFSHAAPLDAKKTARPAGGARDVRIRPLQALRQELELPARLRQH